MLTPFNQVAAHPEKTSPKYDFISTAEVIDTLEGLGWKPTTTWQARLTKKSKEKGLEGFQRHFVAFSSDSDFFLPGDCKLRILVYNAHAGASALRIQLGVYRMICSNGIVAPQMVAEPIRIRHFKTKDGVSAQEKVREAIDILMSKVEHLRECMERMMNSTLTAEQQRILARTIIKQVWSGTGREHLDEGELLQVRREEDKADDAWTVFNRIQENVVRGGLRVYSSDGKQVGRATREIRNIERLRQVNEDMFSTMLQVAA